MQRPDPHSVAGASLRFARQSVLPMIGEEGQKRIGAARVVVIGCGALGSVQAELLVRAGVGEIILADRDIVELHNLQRQLLYDEGDVAERVPKALAAARRLRAVNSGARIEPWVADMTAGNVASLVRDADVVLDGTDNFETRYLINDACVSEGKPWVYGGVLGTAGNVMTIRPGAGPCLRCLLPDPPAPGTSPTCEASGVLNTAVAWVGALQVTETLRLLTGQTSAATTMYVLDAWAGNIRPVHISRDPRCVCCVQGHFDFLNSTRGSAATVLCARNAVEVTPETRTQQDLGVLARRLKPLGRVTGNGMVLEFEPGECRLVVFPDGRVLVVGTRDAALARSLVSKYIGM